MRRYSALLLLSSLVGVTSAFGPSLFGTTITHRSTKLFISSWGPEGPPHRQAQMERKLENPEEKIQSYIPEADIVNVKDNIDGVCLVSGFVKSKERTDQEVFDFLNPNNDYNAFFFKKIVAFVNDVKFAKKRLLSRSARYSGLLDNLDFMQANEPDALPTLEQLEGVQCWVHLIEDDHIENIKKVRDLAIAAPSVENVAMLVANANGKLQDANELKELVAPLKECKKEGKSFTHHIVAVGELTEDAEGQEFYQLRNFTDEGAALPETAEFSRVESLRLLTDCLQLTAADNKPYFIREIYNVNSTEAKLIRGLREAGYLRFQESDHMFRDGVEKYKAAIEEWKTGNPNAKRGHYHNWWEAPEFQETAKKAEEKRALEAASEQDGKRAEIEDLAREWAKREFFRQSMAEQTTLEEKEFIESVWDRAMFEADLIWRKANGETIDEEMELADFKAIQERKKQTMLKRAKEELKELLEEDDVPTPAGNMDEGKDDE